MKTRYYSIEQSQIPTSFVCWDILGNLNPSLKLKLFCLPPFIDFGKEAEGRKEESETEGHPREQCTKLTDFVSLF